MTVILSDLSIRARLAAGSLVIDPVPADAQVQPSSVDVHLGAAFRVFANHRHLVIDPSAPQPDLTEEVVADAGRGFVLHPGEFVLATTAERVGVPADLVCQLEGKSSLGRLGLLVHATAGFVDPGFDGEITLELSNVATLPIVLTPGMPIGQLVFFQMDQPAERPYGHPDLKSKYQRQAGPTASQYHRNVTGDA